MPEIFEPRLRLERVGLGAHKATVTFGVSYNRGIPVEASADVLYYVDLHLKGSDPGHDDSLGIVTRSFLSNGQAVQRLEYEFCVGDSKLDEDVGRDEIYVEVKVYPGESGSMIRGDRMNTNTINRRF